MSDQIEICRRLRIPGSWGHRGAWQASWLQQALGASLATGIGGAIVASSIAGDPPRLGIALVDALMLLFVAVSALTARRITGRC